METAPPQTVEGTSLALSIGYVFFPDDIGFKEKLLGVQRLAGQVSRVTAVWDVWGLDAAFKFAISLFEAESAREHVNLRNPCGW